MALIDIDRHILAEIADIQRKTARRIEQISRAWHDLVELHAGQKALILHLINRIECVDTQNGKEAKTEVRTRTTKKEDKA